MVTVASCFSQVLSLVDRKRFASAVQKHRAERCVKGFSCWDQFVAMLFCQMGSANSLREICGGLATAMGKLVHLGLKGAPSRSTLAYANGHRPWQVYQSVFEDLLVSCRNLAVTKRRKFRFKNPLISLDTTVVDLCLKVFDWAHFRRAKGAIKLHLQLDHQGYLPRWALVTDGKTHDVTAAQTLSFEPETIVVMDAAYTDFRMLARWNAEGVFFVTRAKENLDYEWVVQQQPPSRSNVRKDEIIKLTGQRTRHNYPRLLRRIVVWNEENEREIVLLTNIRRFAASTIASIYKERWQIELFFKPLKQNLKIKTFVGTK
ncbi:MAG: IS4 family transposase [Candidatus Abyssobacteria bacterium SURF_5]|uniref:IS4 family transposase n=1 Tax=Abyssobacteria bacterium (strain SURF_5) TaxID=2093360 RepID=A0A3A4NHH0_ABYX5|nr:MAG: IS4 family transposase [Candidatus Abyssubacteria bacterium SURF_5]